MGAPQGREKGVVLPSMSDAGDNHNLTVSLATLATGRRAKEIVSRMRATGAPGEGLDLTTVFMALMRRAVQHEAKTDDDMMLHDLATLLAIQMAWHSERVGEPFTLWAEEGES